jgi:transcriptional regulator with XRE-family HTH domain
MLRLHDERIQRGWSLAELSRRTGIDQSTLSRIERGLCPVYPGWRRRLVRAFRLRAEALFAESGGEGSER